jgi:hypothetical protein
MQRQARALDGAAKAEMISNRANVAELVAPVDVENAHGGGGVPHVAPPGSEPPPVAELSGGFGALAELSLCRKLGLSLLSGGKLASRRVELDALSDVTRAMGPSAHAKLLMRVWHLVCVVLSLCIAILFWLLLTSNNWRYVWTYSYEPAAGLDVLTYACDLRMVPAVTASITLNTVSG